MSDKSLEQRARQLADDFMQVRPTDPPECGLRESSEALALAIIAFATAERAKARLEEARWWQASILHWAPAAVPQSKAQSHVAELELVTTRTEQPASVTKEQDHD